MASVTGITAERAQEIWDSSVVSGEVSPEGKLLLKTRGGTILDGGSIAAPTISNSWPIGSIFMSVSATNPHSSLGVGTWVAWGTGRVPVGENFADADFNTPEQLGGSKTVTLTGPQSGMPAHSVAISGITQSNSVSSTFETFLASSNPSGSATIARGSNSAVHRGIEDSDHTHNFSGSGSVAAQDATLPHLNLQPYITCYMWKRTA